MSDYLTEKKLTQLIKDETDEIDLRDVNVEDLGFESVKKKARPKRILVFDDSRFLARFRHVTSELFAECKNLDYETTSEKKGSMAFSAWATLIQFTQETLEENMLPAILPETKMCFSQETISVEYLEENLVDVTKDHRDSRGVYMGIGYGPNGEIVLYIGSTQQIFVRIVIHDRRMGQNDYSTDLYRTLRQKRWKHIWKVLAEFAGNPHQSYSYTLESILILMARTIETYYKSCFHPQNTQILVERIYDNSTDEVLYAEEVRGLNHALPLKVGWPMGTPGPKICAICGVESGSKHDVIGRWHFFSKEKPFDSYQCDNCYHLPTNHNKGRPRTIEDQKKLEAIHDAREIRAIRMKGENPSRCDWCGRERGVTGKGHGKLANTTFNKWHSLCLCSEDHQRALKDHFNRLKQPEIINSPTKACEVCLLPQETKFVPYPIKKFLCTICLKDAGSVVTALESSRFLTTKVLTRWDSTYLELVARIQAQPKIIPNILHDVKLLAGCHSKLRVPPGTATGNTTIATTNINDKPRAKRARKNNDAARNVKKPLTSMTWMQSLVKISGPVDQPESAAVRFTAAATTTNSIHASTKQSDNGTDITESVTQPVSLKTWLQAPVRITRPVDQPETATVQATTAATNNSIDPDAKQAKKDRDAARCVAQAAAMKTWLQNVLEK